MLKILKKILRKLFKNKLQITYFALLMGFLNLVFFHFPFFNFVINNTDCKSFNGILLIVSLIVAVLIVNAFVFYIVLYLSRMVGKIFLVLLFILSAVAVYFVNTFRVILDESMIGNVFHTNYEEAGGFISFKLILYIILLGVIPAIFIIKTKIIKVSWKKFLVTSSLTLLFISMLVAINANNLYWFHKNHKQLQGLLMPWSYSISTSRFFEHKRQSNQAEILLPDATIMNNEKAVVVLVIGESARSRNFSLYGYEKNTNPLLSQIPDLFYYPANACATYTIATVRCILKHDNTNDLHEILPNYLYRNNVEVVWRTTNTGEPPVHIEKYQTKDSLKRYCEGAACNYDEVLVAGLKEQIQASQKSKILIILHTSTSHGPNYSKNYPPSFEVFKPACNHVEPGECSQEELFNAYDNTIVYTDYILYRIIEDLKQLNEYKSAMIYVSDHGESLGEKDMYMHGVPMNIAPKEQYEIPFIVWVSDSSQKFKPDQTETLSQNHVFHSILNFLDIQSLVYNETMSIFK